MRWLVVLSIRAYQLLAPATIRNRCIFAESCSTYVLEGARTSGTLEAFRRFSVRWRTCRPGFRILDEIDGQKIDQPIILFADGTSDSVKVLNEKYGL